MWSYFHLANLPSEHLALSLWCCPSHVLKSPCSLLSDDVCHIWHTLEPQVKEQLTLLPCPPHFQRGPSLPRAETLHWFCLFSDKLYHTYIRVVKEYVCINCYETTHHHWHLRVAIMTIMWRGQLESHSASSHASWFLISFSVFPGPLYEFVFLSMVSAAIFLSGDQSHLIEAQEHFTYSELKFLYSYGLLSLSLLSTPTPLSSPYSPS